LSPRLTSALLVSALVRRVGNAGGNAVVVTKGDATAGSILLICLDKGVRTTFRERLLGVDGSYDWAKVGPKADADREEVESWLTRRRQHDSDLWIVELDVPNAERFAAETSGDS
jgi:hypothetical protein